MKGILPTGSPRVWSSWSDTRKEKLRVTLPFTSGQAAGVDAAIHVSEWNGACTAHSCHPGVEEGASAHGAERNVSSLLHG